MNSSFHTIGAWSETGIDVAVILAVDTRGRVLLQLRDDVPHVAAPGKWCLFGGHVEPAEALIDAAMREFAEETGLEFPQNNFVPLVRLIADNGRRHFVYQLGTPIDASMISLQEGAGFAFMNSGQLDHLPMVPAARLALEYYYSN